MEIKNYISAYKSTTDLTEPDHNWFGNAKPVYLVIDFDFRSVDVYTRERANTYHINEVRGQRVSILLPADIDPRAVRSDVKKLYPRLETIFNGYSLIGGVRGVDAQGRLNDEAFAELMCLKAEIANQPYEIFTPLHNYMGIVEAEWYFAGGLSEDDVGTARKGGEFLMGLAKRLYREACDEGAVIRGGAPEIAEFIQQLRDED